MDEKLETTPEAHASELDAVDQAVLAPLVRRALNSEAVEVTDWSHEQLHAGIGAGTAIYRFTGQGRDKGQTVPWSLILKVLRPTADGDDPSATRGNVQAVRGACA
jgi:hypothetical protein